MKDVLILGDGPAAYMAAVYTCTANLETLVVRGSGSSSPVFQGFDKVAGVLNISAQEGLLDLMRRQVANFGVQILGADVRSVSPGRPIAVETDTETMHVRSLIIEGTRDSVQRLFGDGAVSAELESSGIFLCGRVGTMYDEAIVLAASGCCAAFSARDFLL